jgi:transposase
LSRHLLPLIPAGLSVVQVLPGPDRITILTVPKPTSAACRTCGTVSTRVHSHYPRRLADLPWQGRPVILKVRARRFRCPDLACPRRVFAEQLPAMAEPRRRRTRHLADFQRAIAHGMGGEPASRLATRLAMPASGDTLLRLIRTTPIESGPPPSSVTGPLTCCPIARPRPSPSGSGIILAWRSSPVIAPAATQVADRWHLLRNLGDALANVLERHHRDLRTTAKIAAEAENEALPPPDELAGSPPVARHARIAMPSDGHGSMRRSRRTGRVGR